MGRSSPNPANPLSVTKDEMKDEFTAFVPLAVFAMLLPASIVALKEKLPVGVPRHELTLSTTATEEDSLLEQIHGIGEQADDVFALQSHAVILSGLEQGEKPFSAGSYKSR